MGLKKKYRSYSKINFSGVNIILIKKCLFSGKKVEGENLRNMINKCKKEKVVNFLELKKYLSEQNKNQYLSYKKCMYL